MFSKTLSLCDKVTDGFKESVILVLVIKTKNSLSQ